MQNPEELNGLHKEADRDHTVSIRMTANRDNPFWLRLALVELQLDEMALLKCVNVLFAEALKVGAAYATFLAARGDDVAAQRNNSSDPL